MSDEATRTIVCKFETLQDVKLATKILELVFCGANGQSASLAPKNSHQPQGLLQKLLETIWCWKNSLIGQLEARGKDTPVKKPMP